MMHSIIIRDFKIRHGDVLLRLREVKVTSGDVSTWVAVNLVPRVLSLLRESTLVAAGHVSARFLQIPEM